MRIVLSEQIAGVGPSLCNESPTYVANISKVGAIHSRVSHDQRDYG